MIRGDSVKRPKGPSRQCRHQVRIATAVGTWVAWYEKYTGLGRFVLHLPDGARRCSLCGRDCSKESCMKRPDGTLGTGLPALTEREHSVTLSLFRNLNELLSDPNWDDGVPKGKICLMVFSDEYTVRVLLKLENSCLKT